MKILLVGNYAADAQFSMQGFVQSLASGLPSKGVEVTTLAPQTRLARRGANTHGGANKWLEYLDKYALFPPVLRRAARNADLVHIGDQGNAIYTRYVADRAHLLTCHDLLAIRASRGEPDLWSVGRSGKTYQKLIWKGVKRARNIACVSDATQSDLLRLLESDAPAAPPNNPKRRIVRIYNGVYRTLAPIAATDERRALLAECGLSNPDTPFLVHVGGNQAYKNRLGALRIFAEMKREETKVSAPVNDLRFVMAGKPFTEEMRRFVQTKKLGDAVVECVTPTDRQVQALYSAAVGLLFPSLYEGFGLPIIEAQFCDCPVFTTGRPPMNEAGGAAAVYFDPDKPAEAAQIVRTSLQPDKRKRMIASGRANVARFTNEEMVSHYVALYREIC